MKIVAKNGKTYYKGRAFTEDLFFQFFLSNTCLNDACYQCSLRLDHCASDIRIGDFWGHKYRSDKKGVSLVTLNTENGKQFFYKSKKHFQIEVCSFKDLQQSQGTRWFTMPDLRKKVLLMLKGQAELPLIYKKTIRPGITRRFSRLIKRYINF